MNTNTVVCLIIAALWAGAATVAFLLALHSRSKLNTENTRLRVKLSQSQEAAEAWKKVADSRKESSRDGSDGIPSLAGRIRKLATPKPSRINRGPATFRPSSPAPSQRSSYDDGSISNALMFGALASTWNDTTPSGSDSSSSSSSYDSGSSSYDSGSSSSDSGSFSGGDSGSF